MSSLKEAWDSMTERFKNPLLYSFFVSWCIGNYRLVIVIASDEKYKEKISYIEKYIEFDLLGGGFHLLVMPLICAAMYVFLLPLVSLLSTASNAIYERWHWNIKSWQSRKSILTKEQREILEQKLIALNTELRTKAEEASARVSELENAFGAHVNLGLPLLLNAYKEYIKSLAPTWQDRVVRMPKNRTIKGDKDMLGLVAEYGIPKDWAEIFSHIGPGTTITIAELVARDGCDRIEALDRLVSLCALGMLRMYWSGSTLVFELVESSWVALLNGRPA